MFCLLTPASVPACKIKTKASLTLHNILVRYWGSKEWLFLRDFPSIFLSMCFQDFYPHIFFFYCEGLDESCINSEEVLFLISLICNVSKIVAWRWVFLCLVATFFIIYVYSSFYLILATDFMWINLTTPFYPYSSLVLFLVYLVLSLFLKCCDSNFCIFIHSNVLG